MLQLIVYSLLIFLTLLAICDIIGSCVRNGEETNNKTLVWTAPYHFIKNKRKGMKTLKEEVDTSAGKLPTISETV